MKIQSFCRLAVLVSAVSVLSAPGFAQTIDPFYSGNYSYTDLGSIDGVPSNYGGLTLMYNDPNTLIIGGEANTSAGALYSVGVTRDGSGHITGFSGSAQQFAQAPYNDGGVVYGPNNVLFAAQWPVNMLSEYKTGSTAPDKVIDTSALGIAGSLSAFNFVPGGYPGAGHMKLVSYGGGQFYDATLSDDGSGTYDLTGVTQTATLQGGPEGFTYVPLGSPLFTNPSMILSEYDAGIVATYELDANGDPIVGTRRVFMSDLSGAEGAFIDPLTGDFLFSTFGGGSRIIRVTGFAVPEPATFACLGLGMLVLLRRRKASK
ncbi:MAG TPA: PEP-CTERM sorting domain-containing protein [Fimbriimonadaceae bacterium]|nr:PEP-CTERM sorting domain-containing protein [Fimbriimonadaceae bacterium]